MAHISVLCHNVSQTQHTLLQRNGQNTLFKKISSLGMCMFFCCNSWQMKPFLLRLCCCTVQYLDDFLNADDQTSMPQAHWLVRRQPLVVLVCFLEKTITSVTHYTGYLQHKLFFFNAPCSSQNTTLKTTVQPTERQIQTLIHSITIQI